jgi:hypothetical protein
VPVVLLCDFDEAGLFVDRSPSAHTFTNTGCAISTAQARFGASSLLVGTTAGNANRLVQSDSNHADFQFGSGQFTAECWVYFTAAPGSTTVAFVSQFASGSLSWWLGSIGGGLGFVYSSNGTSSTTASATWTPTLNTWMHIAVDRDASNTVRVYRDGVVLVASTVAVTLFASAQPLAVGNDGFASRGTPGYIDEVRVTKGAALYGGAFTPPTAPFGSATAGPRQALITVLLLCLTALQYS